MITLTLTHEECVVLERALGFRSNADDRDQAKALRERIDAERVKAACATMCKVVELRDQDPRAVTMNGKRTAVSRPIRFVSRQTVALNAVQLSCGHIVPHRFGARGSWLVCDACTVEYFGSEK